MSLPAKAGFQRRDVEVASVVAASVCALLAFFGAVGGDARWLAALGRTIVAHGAVPDGVPYATASSAGWPNVPVLAELAFHGLETSLGDRGLMLAQIAAVGIALSILAAGMRADGVSAASPLVLVLVVVGSIPALAVARSQLFSLVLFPVLLALLRSETRRPSRRIWLLVPLVALWSNLHGAVLAGLAVAAAYLLLERSRREPVVALSVLGSCVAALALTPALAGTADYYRGILANEAARQGIGFWAPLGFHAPLDLLLVASGLTLLALAARSRPPAWEIAALAGLAALTVHAERSGVWLLFLAALPAARGFPARRPARRVGRLVFVPVAVVGLVGVVRGPLPAQAGHELVAAAIVHAGGSPILADGVPAEQIALAGGRIWVANPLDAFRRADQRLYLDWLEGRPAGDAALARTRVVLVMRESPAQRRMAAQRTFRELIADKRAVVYVKARR